MFTRCALLAVILLAGFDFYADKITITGDIMNESGEEFVIKTGGTTLTIKKNYVSDVIREEKPGNGIVAARLVVFEKPVKLSVLDFDLKSKNPDYEFLGKGFTEFIGVELIKSRDVRLVERSRLSQVLKEQKLSLTGLVDEVQAVKIGKMISANYLLSGSIVDIAGKFVITYSVLDSATGEVVLQDKVEEDPGKYDFISATIAGAVLKKFGADVPSGVSAKIAAAEVKSVDVPVKFSKAIDAYDRKDYTKAINELESAKALDPESDAVNVYLNKLVFNTSKFRVELFKFASLQNPAFLSLRQSDKLSNTILNTFGDDRAKQALNEVLQSKENQSIVKLDYSFPVSDKLALGAGYFSGSTSSVLERIADNAGGEYFSPTFEGGLFSVSYRFSENFSAGASGSIFRQNLVPPPGEYEYGDRSATRYAWEAGILLKTGDNNTIFDSRFLSSDEEHSVNTTVISVDSEGNPMTTPLYRANEFYRHPYVWENTLTQVLIRNKSYFVFKELNHFYPDKNSYVIEAIPAVESWVADFLSLRAGVEGKYLNLQQNGYFSIGFIGGLTVKALIFEVDVNFEYRSRPSNFIPTSRYYDTLLAVSVGVGNIAF